ncbi:MAG: fasciclin domain-containing protein [Phocaeicola sp.]
MKKITIFSTLLLVLGLTWVSCGGKKAAVPTENLLQLVQATPTLSTLNKAITAAGLETTLSSATDPYTVFAPTDEAFAKLPAGALDALLADPQGGLKNVLLHHVVSGISGLEQLVSDMTLQAANGDELAVTVSLDGVAVNGVKLSVAPVLATNGIVFIIDTVLLPPVKPVTLMQVVEGSADHQTLKAALMAAQLEGALSDAAASLTLFAPTDAAFALLPAGTVEKLLATPEGDLKNILLYHVVGSKVMSADVTEGEVATLLDKKNIKVTIKEGDVYVNNAKVIVKDIEASNGVVHVIDAVLLPQ